MPKEIYISVCVFVSIMAMVLCPNMAEAGAVTAGLIAYWPLDAATIDGEVVVDVFGESDGLTIGDPQIDAGKVGEALLLDGDVDCILVDSEAIKKDYEEISLECWVYINALDDSWNRIISIDDTDFGNENVITLYYDDDDDQHGFFVRAGGESCDAAEDLIQEDIPTEQWLHLMSVWDGKNVRYYENGQLKKEYALSGSILGDNLLLGIGDRADGENADTIQGFIDEVRIYERALSSAEVHQNYQAEGLAVTSQGKLSITWGKIKKQLSF